MAASTGSTVVILAAGLGTRFGGTKQLVEVGANGETIVDILLRRSATAGFERAVIVVAPGTEDLVRSHFAELGASGLGPDLPVALAVQQPVPGRVKPLGTAAAALVARGAIVGSGGGSCAVVNADDVYPSDAFTQLAAHLRDAPDDEHAMVAFRVARTLAASRPVSRALVEVNRAGALVAIREGAVVPVADGLRFEAGNRVRALDGDDWVSMNMWGFRRSVFDTLADAVGDFVASGRSGEVFLPDVVASMVDRGATVRVLFSEGTCVGVTHGEDVAFVRSSLA